ncbi:MAG: flagellar biosynthesis protein FlhB [Campylobacterales bacterium]|nr:flagellar biosynthesis protein FlhB [Campylobacterales bacterium]
MADDQEKTEEPTSKKLDDAKKDGDVPKSQDMAGFFALTVATITIIAILGFVLERVANLFPYYYSFFGKPITEENLSSIATTSFMEATIAVIPLAIAVAIAGAIGYLAQFGFLFTTKPLKPDIKKIDPIKGLKNLFSMQKLIEMVKITAKVSVAFFTGSYVFLMFIEELPTVTLFPMGDQIDWLIEKAIFLAGVMLIVFLVFAVIDLVIVRYQYFKKLRMSKQDLKDEYKNVEGNPEVKARIRRLQQEMSSNRMMSDIPEADVVITNPEHYAVALRYDREKEDVPRCVAKGVDHLAQRIKEIARENNVFIYEEPPLARELYRIVDIGQEIPVELHEAIAEVLGFVYRAENRTF